MRNLIAAIYFVLALFGCNGNGTTIITRATTDGVDAIYSKTRIQGEIARFDCIRSASGRCHYTLFARGCATDTAAHSDPACASRPLEQFTLATGDRRKVTGLDAFDQCVSQDAAPVTPECTPRTPPASGR